MTEKYVLCRREKTSNASGLCAKPIDTPNANNLCSECRKNFPLWPASDPAPIPVYLDGRCRTDAWVRRDTGMTVAAMFEDRAAAEAWLSKHPEYVEEKSVAGVR